MRVLGYTFKDESLLQRALLHSSARQGENNEVLEFLGDALLGFVVAEELFRMHPDWNEGMLSRARAYLVKEESLGNVAKKQGLGEYLMVGKEGERDGYRENISILADTLEAVLAAIYLDGGMRPVRAIIKRLLLKDLDEDEIYDDRSRLQEIVQSRFKEIPKYRVISEKGPPHRRTFKVVVEIGGKVVGEGEGRSKKLASQRAAGVAMKWLKENEGI